MTPAAFQLRNQAGPMGARATRPALAVSLLADDLTGACDAAVAFAARGLRTEVGLAPDAVPDAGVQVWARSTGTRDTSLTEMHGRLAQELHALPPCQHLFKKVDSVFRGNSLEEIVAMLEHTDERVVIAPAHPRLGRYARDGVVHVVDQDAERRVDVVSVLREHGHAVAVLAAGLGEEARRECLEGSRIVFCDAETAEDLSHAVDTAQRIGDPVLWVGSGGLAEALAHHLHGSVTQAGPRPQRAGGTLFFFIGSNHPATLRQVESLQQTLSGEAVGHLRIVPVERGNTTEAALREPLADLPGSRIGCLFMTGGDTALQVCAALEIDTLRLCREFAPGLPEAVVEGGPFSGVPVLLKSGGFGHDAVLCEIAETFASVISASQQERCM